jgi:hypothetical protein
VRRRGRVHQEQHHRPLCPRGKYSRCLRQGKRTRNSRDPLRDLWWFILCPVDRESDGRVARVFVFDCAACIR